MHRITFKAVLHAGTNWDTQESIDRAFIGSVKLAQWHSHWDRVRENPWLQLQRTRHVLLNVRNALTATTFRFAAK
jgi:hypothetical protein